MIIPGQYNCKYHIKQVLNKMDKINKWQYNTTLEVLMLFMSIKGRLNFLQLGRFGSYGEQHYRNQFSKPIEILDFNKHLVESHGSGHYTIAFDPSYIEKSGKHTPGVNWFWSGVAGAAKWGLEIGGIAAIDIENHTAFHLEAVQTIKEKNVTLLEHYANVICQRSSKLKSLSSYVVADAYFSKAPFVNKLMDNKLHLVSRLRSDAALKYIFCGEQKKYGRPREYGDKIDLKKLDMNVFRIVEYGDKTEIYEAVVHSKALKRYIKVVIVLSENTKGYSHKIYFSTDIELDAKMLLTYYQTRFQIEFLYRDAKQFTGLNNAQTRCEKKLNYHFNTSLTAINIAKITYWITVSKDKRGPFSMSTIKTLMNNELLLKRFFDVFGISPNTSKNKAKFEKLLKWGAIAA